MMESLQYITFVQFVLLVALLGAESAKLLSGEGTKDVAAASSPLLIDAHDHRGTQAMVASPAVDSGVAGDTIIKRKKSRGRSLSSPRNYIASDEMIDGEHEARLHFSGVSGKQTSVGPSEGSPRGLVVWEVSNGRQLLILIHTGLAASINTSSSQPLDLTRSLEEDLAPTAPDQQLDMKDCNIETDLDKIETFIETFRQESHTAHWQDEATPSWSDVQFRRVRSLSELPEQLRPMANFRALKRKCRRHQKQVKAAVRAARRQQRPQAAPSSGTSRSRRSLAHSLMIPHTKWCGVGSVANSYPQLGGNAWADTCCREHDHSCPYFITSWQTKYGLTNWSMKTYNHCNCDARFRTCLKASNTGAANLVGRVFFDMVRTECFVFKKVRSCLQKSWWRGCQRYGITRKAVLRDPLPWTR